MYSMWNSQVTIVSNHFERLSFLVVRTCKILPFSSFEYIIHIHYSVSHSSPDIETTKVSMNRWMDYKTMMCIYTINTIQPLKK